MYVCLYNYRVKVSYSSDNSVKAILLKDKTAKAEPASKPQQYIEVSLSKYTSLLALEKKQKVNIDYELND